MTPRKRRQRLDSIREIADRLRESEDVAAPDLTGSILDRVQAQRPFLDRRTRRMLWAGRACIGLSVAVVVLGVALTQRWAPGAVELVSRPAPLSNVVELVKDRAEARLGVIRVAVDAGPATRRAAGQDGPGDAGGSGGLLTLVSAAAPREPRTAPCLFCGPLIPPSEAARAVPVAGTELRDPVSLSSLKSSVAASVLPARVSMRLRTIDADAQRVILDDVAPLGSGPGAESALAPK